MNEQGEMQFPTARDGDPESSFAAAADAAGHASQLRGKCLVALRDAGARGLTDFELADAVGSIQTSAGKRRLELMRAGLVEYAETHRPSPTGSKARVWRAT